MKENLIKTLLTRHISFYRTKNKFDLDICADWKNLNKNLFLNQLLKNLNFDYIIRNHYKQDSRNKT